MGFGERDAILLALAILAGLVFALLARRPAIRPIASRVCVGDGACTADGLYGLIEQVAGDRVLLRTAGGAGIWVDAAALLDDEGLVRASDSSIEPAPTSPPPPVSDGDGGKLAQLGAIVHDARKVVIAGWIALILVCMPLASTLEQALVSGGFIPDGESQQVQSALHEQFQQPRTSIVVVVPGAEAEVAPAIAKAQKKIGALPDVVGFGPSRTAPGGDAVSFTIGFDAEDDAARGRVEAIEKAFVAQNLDGVAMTGKPVFARDIEQQTKRDLMKAETIGIPAALIVLLIVFGTVPSALLPILVGATSVWLTLAGLHIIALGTDLSIFVMNIATMLGLGIGIDYSLVSVSRFRSELDAGADVRTATMRTVAAAGRAVAVSGAAVFCGLAGLLLLPLTALQSIAIGGALTVAATMLASLTLLPAMLALLGHNIERWPVRGRGLDAGRQQVWRRISHASMRKPVTVLVIALLVLGALSMQVLGAKVDLSRTEMLPSGSPARAGQAALEKYFDEPFAAPIWITARAGSPEAEQQIVDKVSAVDGIKSAKVAARRGSDKVLIHATSSRDATGGPGNRDAVSALKDAGRDALPAGAKVGGQGANEVEFFEIINTGLPRVLGFVFLSTLFILLFAFRSVALPIKAIVLDCLSLAATLGVVVIVFQHGFGASLIGAHQTGFVEASVPIVLFCLLFGVSMDYEVFMLARIAELYQSGHSNRTATAEGMAETAPLVTGAALIMIVIGASFAMTELVLVKQLGLGLAVSLAIDATIVRALLLPSAMRLMGNVNWWVPRWLALRIPRSSWAH